MKKVLAVHGPDLNPSGKREPHPHGNMTLHAVLEGRGLAGRRQGMDTGSCSSNHEGDVSGRSSRAPLKAYDNVTTCHAAFTRTRTRLATRDAQDGCGHPFFEGHVSKIHDGEKLRQESLVSDIMSGVVTGSGSHGYRRTPMGAETHPAPGVGGREE